MEEFFARFFTNLADRVGGPMTFRVILQPTMAILLAVRAGLKDAREGRPPYFWTLLSHSPSRGDLIREGWRATARVFVLAIVMDIIYQLLVLRWFYIGETVVVAITLAVIPYILFRGPVNRLARRWRRRAPVGVDPAVK
jgi:hypothetical protein